MRLTPGMLQTIEGVRDRGFHGETLSRTPRKPLPQEHPLLICRNHTSFGGSHHEQSRHAAGPFADG